MPTKRHHISEVLAEVFKRSGFKRQLQRAEAVLLWRQVAGSELSRFTEAKSLKDGVLWVEVPDSETAMHLTLQRQRFLDVYRGKFGVSEVRDIRFRVGRPAPPPPPPPPKLEPLPDPQALARLARSISNLPEPLVPAAMQAARALATHHQRKRAEGWRSCPLCEALTPHEGLCDSCQRYRDSPKVMRAARLLAVKPQAPTPLLSAEERAVAAHLAQGYLLEALNALLPQVLADPSYRRELDSVARCYLAHRLGKPVDAITEADFDHLDSRIARALGRWQGLEDGAIP